VAGRPIEGDGGSGSDKVGYKLTENYESLHVGIGHLLKLSEQQTLDVYGKYFWTHQGGKTVRLSNGEDSITFSAINSSRLRLGARYTHEISKETRFYVGGAVEHEFDGKAKAQTHGYKIEAPSLKGTSGIAEAGITLMPNANKGLSVDLGFQAYGGRRSGGSGSVLVNYKF
jgi:outer membrane autotransporter protein